MNLEYPEVIQLYAELSNAIFANACRDVSGDSKCPQLESDSESSPGESPESPTLTKPPSAEVSDI